MFSTLSLVLGLAVTAPVVAGENETAGKRQPVVAVAAGTKLNRPTNIALVCNRSRGFSGRSMPAAPMYPPQSAPQAMARPAASPAAPPVAAGQPARPVPAGEVVLSNPEPDTILYSLNSAPFDLYSGYVQKLTTRDSWVVEFDRGGNFGTARYTLTRGNYRFSATDRGWDLVRESDAPAAPVPGPQIARLTQAR
jgi:hypothetical protein